MKTTSYDPAIGDAREQYREALATAITHMKMDIDRCMEELRREIDKRAGVYPTLIAKGTLTADQAAQQTVRLHHALGILEIYRAPTLFGEDV